MNRLLSIVAFGLTLTSAPLITHAAKPNIILIMADDIGYECFGSYGSQQYKTPNIDRLAAGGMQFSHAYAQPLCTPSRVKLMTGKSNVRNYAAFSVLRSDQRTFGHSLHDAGYISLVAGKWQLLGAEHYSEQFRGKGSTPGQAGFDHHCLWQVEKLGERYWSPLLTIDGKNHQYGKDDYGPEIVTKHILEFIETNQKGPFLVYYPMILVHNPFSASPDSTSRDSEDTQRNFEDMVVTMDRLVGRIADKVRQLGIEKNTLLLFTGDNGTNKAITSRLNGRDIQGGKGKTTDDGTRVAFIANWPGTIPAGRTSNDLLDFSDVFPTLMEVAGHPIPTGLDGQSFLPQLLGKRGTPRESIFMYYNPRPESTKPIRFTRNQHYKLYGDGRFIDVVNDVEEKSPLKPPFSDAAANSHQLLLKALNRMPSEGQSLLKFGPASHE